MRLLLLSSSREGRTGYLEHARPFLQRFLGTSVSKVVFIPYAGVTVTYDDYTAMVRESLQPLNIQVEGIHTLPDPIQAIRESEAILVGGGNTFHLLYQLYKHQLITPIRSKVQQGTPYVGWSAGSNISAPSIRTTNDMPIIEPPSFAALGLVPFQINPHYTDEVPSNHNGETREQRLLEFCVVNPDCKILGLREGSGLLIDGPAVSLVGNHQAVLFNNGDRRDIDPDETGLTSLLL